jgi:hypothetical protein
MEPLMGGMQLLQQLLRHQQAIHIRTRGRRDTMRGTSGRGRRFHWRIVPAPG